MPVSDLLIGDYVLEAVAAADIMWTEYKHTDDRQQLSRLASLLCETGSRLLEEKDFWAVLAGEVPALLPQALETFESRTEEFLEMERSLLLETGRFTPALVDELVGDLEKAAEQLVLMSRAGVDVSQVVEGRRVRQLLQRINDDVCTVAAAEAGGLQRLGRKIWRARKPIGGVAVIGLNGAAAATGVGLWFAAGSAVAGVGLVLD